MKLLTWHLNKAVLSSLLIILTVVLGLDYIFGIFEEAGKLVNNYQLPQLAYFNLLSLFDTTLVFLPFIALLAAVIGLARIKAHNELVIIQASGFSKLRIILAMSIGILIFVMSFFIAGELWQLKLEDYLKTYKYEKKWGSKANLYSKQDSDIWLNVDNSLVRIRTARSDGNLYGITQFYFDEKQDLKKVIWAQKATNIEKSSWRLDNIHQLEFVPIDKNIATEKIGDRLNKKIQQLDVKSKQVHFPIDTEYLIYSQTKPRKMNLVKLYGYATYLEQRSKDSTLYRTLFWRKLLTPFNVFFLIALGASFIFETNRTKPLGMAIFKVLFLGILFLLLQDALAPLATSANISPFVVSVIPVLFIATWAGFRLNKI